MNYTVEQLIHCSEQELADILNMFRTIPGRTCTAANYLEYLGRNWFSIGIFVVRNDIGKIQGFTQAQVPGLLDPQSAWLPFTCNAEHVPHEYAQKALELAEEWMRGFGAVRYKFHTVRDVKLLKRKWGMKRSKEVIMEKEL